MTELKGKKTFPTFSVLQRNFFRQKFLRSNRDGSKKNTKKILESVIAFCNEPRSSFSFSLIFAFLFHKKLTNFESFFRVYFGSSFATRMEPGP